VLEEELDPGEGRCCSLRSNTLTLRILLGEGDLDLCISLLRASEAGEPGKMVLPSVRARRGRGGVSAVEGNSMVDSSERSSLCLDFDGGGGNDLNQTPVSVVDLLSLGSFYAPEERYRQLVYFASGRSDRTHSDKSSPGNPPVPILSGSQTFLSRDRSPINGPERTPSSRSIDEQ
jgi:hypothetical protein